MTLEENLRQLINSIVDERIAAMPQRQVPAVPDPETESTRSLLERIMAKHYISIREVALMFGCSENHIRNLLQRAAEGTTQHPIPFCSLDGLITFERTAVLDWAHQSKPLNAKQRKSGGKRKRLLQVVNS